jgi:integrase
MPIDPEEAHRLLPRVDPGRVRSGQAVGLRDGAVLALLAVGLKVAEIAALRASDIEMEGGRAVVVLQCGDAKRSTFLPTDLGARVLAWLTESRIWGLPEPVFGGCRGPLTPMGIFKIVERYRNPQPETRQAVHQPTRPLLLAHWPKKS